MLKKIFLTSALLSSLISTAYADAAINIDVADAIHNQEFALSPSHWDYQFNNKTGKNLTFTLTVEKTSQSAVHIQCWHGFQPVEEYDVQPGQTSNACVTNDVIRIMTAMDKMFASGTYTIAVGE